MWIEKWIADRPVTITYLLRQICTGYVDKKEKDLHNKNSDKQYKEEKVCV